MLRVIIGVLGVTTFAVISGIAAIKGENSLSQSISAQKTCAFCNKELEDGGKLLRCSRHKVHTQCFETLQNIGQMKCPQCFHTM